jgi:hypothetical protein
MTPLLLALLLAAPPVGPSKAELDFALASAHRGATKTAGQWADAKGFTSDGKAHQWRTPSVLGVRAKGGTKP